MPSYRLIIVFVLLGALVLLKSLVGGQMGLLIWIIPIVIIIAALFVLKPQVDYWWHQRFPPDLDPIAKRIVSQYSFYQRLSGEDKDKFRGRVAIFANNKEFIGMKIEDIPDDLKIMVAANACILTLDQEDYLLEPFDCIILYNHPFPSPQFPDELHVSELETTDGTLLFSVPHILTSQFTYGKFNIVMYEWAKALLHKYPDHAMSKRTWEDITKESRWTYDRIRSEVGLSDIDVDGVSMVVDMYSTNLKKTVID